MKTYIQYTEEELDKLYASLSETAQDFVYGGVISEEVAHIGQEIGLHVDKWSLLDTLVLETILGIVPSSLFASEITRRLSTSPEITNSIVSYMDENIFSIIRDDAIEGYSETNQKNAVEGGAIFDEAQDSLTVSLASDPYREDPALPHTRGPVITEEKLHIVDELFAAHQPKVKELTPADGSVRIAPSDSPHAPELFVEKDGATISENPINKPSSEFVITREMLEAEEAIQKGQKGSFVGMEKVDELLAGLPNLSPSAENIISPTGIESVVSKEEGTKTATIKLHFEKKTGGEKGIRIRIEKVSKPTLEKQFTAPVSFVSIQNPETIPKKTKPTDEAHPSDILPHVTNQHYTVDPYKEVL